MENTNSKKREKVTFNLDHHPEFPATNESAMMSTKTITKYVNSLMSKIFADYIGCNIYIDNSPYVQTQVADAHPVRLELYFQLTNADPTLSNRIYAVRSVADKAKDYYEKGSMNYVARTMGHNNIVTQNKTTELTQDAVDILSKMLWREIALSLPIDATPEDFEKKSVSYEAYSTSGSPYTYVTPATQRTIYHIVTCVDINSIFDILFNDSDNDDERFVYQILPVKPIIFNNVAQNSDMRQKWLFSVNRISPQKFNDLCNEIGIYDRTNGINIFTESF